MRGSVLALISLAAPAAAGDFSLQAPIACDLQSDCFIQQYVDRDPSPNVSDFACGTLSYDGHKGTDFAVPTLERMRQGVSVAAAAPGTVSAIRDGMPDSGFGAETAASVEGRECGNGIVIDHKDGWQTQYCHLRNGSITVEKGAKVRRGQTIGLVGMSGRAQFPHVHLSVRRNGETIDPYAPNPPSCTPEPDETLWQDKPDFRPAGIISIGLSNGVPEYSAIKDGTVTLPTKTGGALVVFANLFGPRAGDTLELILSGPSGAIIRQSIDIKKDQATAFRAIGRKRKGADWPSGTYKGQATLTRAGKALESRTSSFTLP